MRQFFLPRSANLSFEHLAQALSQAPSVLHLPDQVSLRAIVFQKPDGEWVSFASCLAIGIGDGPTHTTVHEVGPLKLVHIAGKVSEVSSSDNLKAFMASWKLLTDGGAKHISFHSQVQIYRESSHNQFCKYPAWRANFQHTFPSSASTMPEGPFFDPHSDFFAMNVGDAAAQWLGIQHLRAQFSIQNHVELLLPDRRAYIEDIGRKETTITVSIVTNIAESLFCAVVVTNYDGNNHQFRVSVQNNLAEIDITIPPKTIQLFLMGADGFCYDNYYEDEHRRTRIKSVLAPARQLSDQAYKDLLEDLNRGENERIEFKEWIPTDRKEKKSYELLKVISAFANSRGGVLYIGVTDELEIKGLARHLIIYDKTKSDKFEKKQLKYVLDLKRMIGDGISPPINIEFQWITHADHHILRLNVPQGKDAPYQIIETQDIFIRRGGSCTKARVSDLELFFKRDHPQNTPIDHLFRS
jgi:hypothetical protein